MRIKGSLLVGLFALFLTISLYGCAKNQGNPKTVAIVNGRPITVKQFKEKVSKMPKHIQNFLGSPDGEKYLLNNMVTTRALLDEARREGITKTAAFRNRMSEIKKQIIIQTLLKKHMTAVKVTDADAKAYYDKVFLKNAPKNSKIKPTPFLMIKGRIIAMLERQKKIDNLKKFVNEIKNKAHVKYFYNNLPHAKLAGSAASLASKNVNGETAAPTNPSKPTAAGNSNAPAVSAKTSGKNFPEKK